MYMCFSSSLNWRGTNILHVIVVVSISHSTFLHSLLVCVGIHCGCHGGHTLYIHCPHTYMYIHVQSMLRQRKVCHDRRMNVCWSWIRMVRICAREVSLILYWYECMWLSLWEWVHGRWHVCYIWQRFEYYYYCRSWIQIVVL